MESCGFYLTDEVSELLALNFGLKDSEGIKFPNNDALVIWAIVADYEVA